MFLEFGLELRLSSEVPLFSESGLFKVHSFVAVLYSYQAEAYASLASTRLVGSYVGSAWD